VAVRHLSFVARVHLPRKGIVGLVAFLGIALLPCEVALADTYSTGFEPSQGFAVASVGGQHGWISPPSATDPACTPTPPSSFALDQGVVDTATYVSNSAPAFGSQSLRFSNLCANGAFGGSQIYSPLLADPAGENEPNKVLTFEFSFIPTTTSYQPGLYVSVSPDNGTGHRMLRIDLTDMPMSCGDSTSCVLVSVADSPSGADGYIVSHPLALLDPAMAHTIKVSMQFNPGEDNDLTRVSIDGTDTGQCFTSWETYYRLWQPENVSQSNSDLEFRASVHGFTATNGGFLFDNVSYASSTGPSPQGCDVPIEKTAESATVSAGGLVGFRITARNRGRMTARNYLVCDDIPRETTFVSADRKLRRIGSKRCFLVRSLKPGQSTSVNLTLRVNTNARPGTLDNTADETPVQPPGVPAVPPAVTEDEPAGPSPSPIKPIKKVKVLVKVLAAKATLPPPVTG
jgi:uncharacterized repeat protein (TIGR01451 family)